MTEPQDDPKEEPTIEELRAETASLQRQLQEVTETARARVIRAELKAEAVRAGMIDLDGLKLLDAGTIKLNSDGEVEGASAIMAKFKRDKPWLFGALSSSSRATPPAAEPPRQKRASEMSPDEYRVARAEMLRRR